MLYFAKIVKSLVTKVVAINNDITNGAEFCNELFGGVWVETYINTTSKNYAGIGYTYDAKKQNFIAPQPYPSWTLDENDQWQPPTPQPPAPPQTHWNEELQRWVVL